MIEGGQRLLLSLVCFNVRASYFLIVFCLFSNDYFNNYKCRSDISYSLRNLS